MSASTCEGTNVLRTRVVLPRTSARTVNEFNAPMWNSGAVAPRSLPAPRTVRDPGHGGVRVHDDAAALVTLRERQCRLQDGDVTGLHDGHRGGRLGVQARDLARGEWEVQGLENRAEPLRGEHGAQEDLGVQPQ